MTDQPPAYPASNQPPAYPPASQPPAYSSPSYPTAAYGAPSPYGAPPSTDYPGKTLGIVALIASCVFFFGIAVIGGLVMGIIARNQSKAVGIQNGPAKAAIIISSILIGLYVLLIVGLIIFSFVAAAACGSSPYACS